jgi:hypothetical protein
MGAKKTETWNANGQAGKKGVKAQAAKKSK